MIFEITPPPATSIEVETGDVIERSGAGSTSDIMVEMDGSGGTWMLIYFDYQHPGAFDEWADDELEPSDW